MSQARGENQKNGTLAKGKARWRRWLRRIVVVMVVLVLLVGALPYVAMPWLVRRALPRVAGGYWQGDVAVDDARFRYFGPMELTGLSVRDEQERSWLAVDGVQVGLRDWPGTHPVVNEITVGVMTVRCYVDGGRLVIPYRTPEVSGPSDFDISSYVAPERVTVNRINLELVDDGRAIWQEALTLQARGEGDGYHAVLESVNPDPCHTLRVVAEVAGADWQGVIDASIEMAVSEAVTGCVSRVAGIPYLRKAEGRLAVTSRIEGPLTAPGSLASEGTLQLEQWTVGVDAAEVTEALTRVKAMGLVDATVRFKGASLSAGALSVDSDVVMSGWRAAVKGGATGADEMTVDWLGSGGLDGRIHLALPSLSASDLEQATAEASVTLSEWKLGTGLVLPERVRQGRATMSMDGELSLSASALTPGAMGVQGDIALRDGRGEALFGPRLPAMMRRAMCQYEADIHLDGPADYPVELLDRAQLRIEAAELLSPRGVFVKEGQGIVDYTPDRLVTRNLRAGVFDGTVEGLVEILKPLSEPEVKGTVSFEGLQLASLTRAMGQDRERNGVGSGVISCQLRPGDPCSLELSGGVFLDDFDLSGEHRVLALIAAVFSRLHAERAVTKSDVRLLFDMAGMTVTIREGRLANALAAIDVEPGGRVNLGERTIDLYMIGTPARQFRDLMEQVPVLRLIVSFHDRFSRIRLKGHLDDPPLSLIEVHPIIGIPGSSIEFFKDIIEEGGNIHLRNKAWLNSVRQYPSQEPRAETAPKAAPSVDGETDGKPTAEPRSGAQAGSQAEPQAEP